MEPTNESGLVGAITRKIKALYPDAWVLKVHGGEYQTAGVPDLLVCVEGRLAAIEVKFQRPGESVDHARSRATMIQQAQIQKILDAGGIAGVAVSVAEAIYLVQQAADQG